MKDKITDLSDQATAVEELFRETAIRRREPNGPPATGACLFCESPLEPPMRWCDAACRDDWERGDSCA